MTRDEHGRMVWEEYMDNDDVPVLMTFDYRNTMIRIAGRTRFHYETQYVAVDAENTSDGESDCMREQLIAKAWGLA